jgi:formylglycine-generating enzyme required for sulfatase activity
VNAQGSAYVYVRSGTAWSQQQQLVASDGGSPDRFGISVSLSTDTAIVGAYLDDVGANADQGSAYAFVRSGTAWGQQAHLVASDGLAGDHLGSSVSVSGDTAIVGAPAAASQQGSAYVFVRSGTTWAQQVKLTASDGAPGDQFGGSVSVSGDYALVGALAETVSANAGQGSAYVFVRSGTIWAQQQKLTASDGASGDQFGGSVSVSGDTALVGANHDAVGANAGQGSAYVFVRTGTTWTQQGKLVASDGTANDQLGTSVSVSGDTALVGANNDTVGANAAQGSAYTFVRSGTAWAQQKKLTASDGAANDQFGTSVAVSGDTALAGAALDDVGASDQGSAYVFVGIGGVSCCSSSVVTGGSFYRSYDGVGYTSQAYPATVSNFALDTYEITVGRFRKFVAAYSQNMVATGAGKNPMNPTDTGWNTAWNASLPADSAALQSAVGGCPFPTWTSTAGANENLAMDCIDWYEALAFCIWDGARLPTEAEWNYAAAGGSEQRVYPWSTPATSTVIDSSYARFGGTAGPNGVGSESPKGDGKWGQADLAGNVWEWTLDGFANPYAQTPCTDCANEAATSSRVYRGGSFASFPPNLMSAVRNSSVPTNRVSGTGGLGARCARAP